MADTNDLLIEIGTEELPPKALKTLALEFGTQVRARLGSLGLVSAQREQIYCSPRRLAVMIPSVRIRQVDRHVELQGPPIQVAFDPNDRPTAAAEGFARKCGTTVDKLSEKNGKLFYKTLTKGKPAAELVPKVVDEALAKLPIPRRMRWGAGESEFVRPVHWVVMLLGDKPIKGDVLGVAAGNKTYGHRFHHPAAITLKRPADYQKLLLKTGKVWVEDAKGSLKKKVAALVNQAAKGVKGKAQLDEALLEEVAALVEYPVAVTGSFDPKFLALPDEVIVSVLQGQQRYFPLRDAKGRLLPRFVTISNIQSRRPAEVKRGNERVIVPRLTDAMFFWNEDRKHTLESRIADLDRMVFQKELGSYGQKRQRIAALAQSIASRIGGDALAARRAAELAKCDLLTHLVGEFPELQGVVGGHLALVQNESAEVAQAIGEQYLPRFAGDRLPASKAGQALAIADKLDTVCGLFAAGQKPTGEKDPFALRRQALGVLRIAIERKLDLDLPELILQAVRQVKDPSPQGELLAVFAFFQERLRAYYEERGIRADVFDAVEVRDVGTPLDIDQRLTALQSFLALPEAKNLAAANKRIANILKQAGLTVDAAGEPVPERFTEPAERALYASLVRLEEAVHPQLARRDYTPALKALAALREPVDAFFDKVMVMVDDTAVRTNRLALLARLSRLFLHIADLSRLQAD